MQLLWVSLLVVSAQLAAATTYDRYSGEPVNDQLKSKYEASGITETCTIDVAECDASERRRMDGSCANLRYPVKGSFLQKARRVLPAHYGQGSDPRKAASGKELPLPRKVRTTLLSEGKAASEDFTAALPGFGVWMFSDVGSIHDIRFFLINKTDCCGKGINDYQCTPNFIPEDDPVHRFSDIRCMNLTRPLVWTDLGCTDDPEPAPLEYATSVFDLNQVYNPIDDGGQTIRTFDRGHFIVDVDEKGVVWPPNGEGFCGANRPGETRCFGHSSNELLETMFYSIWALRQHNLFADKLAELNPCWDDETLYQTAKDINSAFIHQIYFYEWLPALIGYDYLVKLGVISNETGYRNVYDETIQPQVSLEYLYSQRWFHTIQEGSAPMFSPDGTHLGEISYVDTFFRPGYLALNDNIITLTPHMYRSPAAKTDYGVDPDLAERGIPYLQRSVDVLTSDVHKSRLLGFAPYIDYVQFCTGHNITSFQDLEPHMEPERIYQMQTIYEDVRDMDLMAGLWAEKHIDGGKIPATLACLLAEFLYRAVRYDRHWYESDDRPYAFTPDQLAEIRKSSLAIWMCNAADQVTEVQREAFRLISSKNPLLPCSEHSNLDFSPWADPKCGSDSTCGDSTSVSSASSSASSSGSDDTTSSSSASESSSSATSDE